jgi:putative DNA primase/helicase
MRDLRSAARLLSGEVSGRQILCPGPGHSRHDRSLAVRLEGGGFVVHSFAGDDWKVCKDYVRGVLGLDEARPVAPLPERPERPVTDDLEKIAQASRIWHNSVPIEGTPAEAYLERRGLFADRDARQALRYHAACPFKGERIPALVAAMADARTNEFRGVHRTRLTPKDKAMLGPAKGAVIKLTPDEEVTTGLHICEGIETGLALIGMGFRPLWACMSAGNLAAFPVLSGIEALTIFADNDPSRTGERDAIKCAQRWRAAGAQVRIFMTPEAGTDFADFAEVAA